MKGTEDVKQSRPNDPVMRAALRESTRVRLVLACALAAALGCAGTAGVSGERWLRRGELDRALPLLLAAESAKPRDAELKRSLGIALYRSGRAEEALEKLRASDQLQPNNRETLYFLARSAEATGARDAAIDAYGAYLKRGGPRKVEARARLRELSLERVKRDVEFALAREDSVRAASIPENSVVVPRFTNVADRAVLDPLSRGLALVLTTDLSRVRQLRVLERERMNVLLDEVALAAADTSAPGAPVRTEVDPATAPRYGALLGARRFVQGSFVPVAETGIQLDAAVIDATQGELATAGQPLSGSLSDVLVLEKALCLHVLELMGIAPTAEERAAINLLPTSNYRAFLAFARGVGYEDQGDFGNAIAAYQEATALDPKFDVARLRGEVLEVTDADLEAADEAEARSAYGRELDPRDRLMRTGKWSWLVPDTDSATNSETETVSGPNSVGDRNGAASIAITGSIPRR